MSAPGESPGAPSLPETKSTQSSIETAPQSVLSALGRGEPAPLPRSLRGTAEDGGLLMDEDGGFVVTGDALDLFDYYLAAQGEESADALYARILAAIKRHATGAAAQQAQALLDDYLLYRERAGEMLGGDVFGEDLPRRLQYIRELRREIFGAEVATALFGAEEARWFADMERRRVISDASLSDDERAEHLADIEASQPEEAIVARRAARVHRTLRQDEQQLLRDGAGELEIAQLRTEQFGEAGAERLAELDRARAGWQRKLEAYQLDRATRLQEVPTLEQAALVEAIRQEHFEGGELIRVRALDAMN